MGDEYKNWMADVELWYNNLSDCERADVLRMIHKAEPAYVVFQEVGKSEPTILRMGVGG